MARLPRLVAAGYPHHVTQRGVRSLPIFRHDDDRQLYLTCMAEQTRKFRVEILAWCLMNNHVHLVAVPSDEGGLARGIGEAHRRYSWMRNRSDEVTGYLFQGRFFSCVLDEHHLLTAVRYAEQNPVRASLVEKPWQYPWSSSRFHVGEADSDPLVKDRDLLGLVLDWRSFLLDRDPEAEARVRKSVRTGRPAGDSSFLRVLEERTGRLLTKKRGRPRKEEK